MAEENQSHPGDCSSDGEAKIKRIKLDEDWCECLTIRERNLHMLEHEIDTDCTFVVGLEDGETKQFKAHRFLLCNASAVFKKMLTGEMVEAKTGHVRVTDLSPDTFQLLLRFLYTDEASMATFEEARDVALAADKYQLKLLFEKCLSSMCDHVTPENVWSALKFVQLLPHEPLKQACVKVMQAETRKCIEAEDFLQADEEAVALLLEQDVVNVESELQLVVATLKWVPYEVRRRGLSGATGARAVLQPRLWSLLRLLTIEAAHFAGTFENSILFTAKEKWSIIVCMLTGKSSGLPSYFSANLVPRKRSSSIFYCQRKVLDALENFQNNNFIVEDRLVFRVKCNIELQLLGFQILSRILKDDTKLDDMEHSYNENIKVVLYNCGNSLLYESDKCEKLVEFQFTEHVTCNSTISIYFPQPILLKKGNWFQLTMNLSCSGDYPNARLETNVVCQDVPIEVEFEFYNSELTGRYRSFNDGFFRALIFSL